MDHDLRFTRATRRRSPLPVLATLGLVLFLAVGFLVDLSRGSAVRLTEPASLRT